MTDMDRLQRLLDAGHPCISVVTHEEDYALDLLRRVAVERQCDLWLWSISRGVCDGLLAGSAYLADTEHPAAAMYYWARNSTKPGMHVALDLTSHLKDARTMRLFREAVHRCGELGSHLVLVDAHDDCPPLVKSIATRLDLSLPDDKEIEQIVRRTLKKASEKRRLEVYLNAKDLHTVVRNLRGLSRRQARQIILDTIAEDPKFDASDVNTLLAGKRRAIGDGLLEYIESPTDLKSIGGLNRFKHWLTRRRDALSDDAVKYGLNAPRGVLMLGVQGAGKSLSAKAVATAWQRPLLRMDVGALYDRWIGESERRLNEALQQAERMSPVVLWIDEIEKGFASAASQSTDGGLSKRMFGSLLTWMQEHKNPVFLFATANDIEALPPELLRKGRFDEIFFADLPNLEARTQIFQIHLTKRKRDPKNFDLAGLAEATDGFSGAEIEQAIISAMHDAFANHDEVTTRHILEAAKGSPPLSVTMAEKVAMLRAWAKARCVPAD